MTVIPDTRRDIYVLVCMKNSIGSNNELMQNNHYKEYFYFIGP
jgi:hypothetical protein